MARKVMQTRQVEEPVRSAPRSIAEQASIRRPRHWREHFTEGVPYIFMRPMLYDGERRQAGDPVPVGIARLKLRNLWNARCIRRADLVAVT